ncbi:Demethylrebeccamycin-D-glucose O-methyltransferase [Mycobacterium simulans]|uniref:Demethylrebeccamycin-D-glucose O-methyltransferase n=2 Tax=Mycobacterium simulans TaxID=627089 RepID=A0A7Z7N8I2_9MYCO|nr:Demethylrebeccamycin-D-glucose O-methyltransferase [Mycobacterium simulans]
MRSTGDKITLEPIAEPHSQPVRVPDSYSLSWRNTVSEYYNKKTASVLKKYGPGPLVHFHTGLFSQSLPLVPEPNAMRARLVASQELLLDRAAEAWNADRNFRGEVLDVGCGLGGGSIYWASRYGANVTGVTIAEAHLPLVSEFAEMAGVSERVRVLLVDACEVPTDRTYDTAVALESSCHFSRTKWFARLAKLLRPGGQVCIEDIFWRRPGGTRVWDNYFRTRSGSMAEYLDAAGAAGFRLADRVDLSAQAPEFWLQSIGWIDATLDTGGLDREELQRLQISRRTHKQVYREWLAGGCERLLLRFERIG